METFYRFYVGEPGYRELWLGSQLTSLLVATGKRWGEEFSEQIGELLGQFNPGLSPQDRHLVALSAIHVVSTLVTLACHREDGEAEAIVGEAKKALRAYLALYLDPRPRRSRGRGRR